MAILSLSQTLSPLHLPRNPNPKTPKTLTLSNSIETERSLDFDTGDSFFRRESAVGRDLGVLAAALHRRSIAHRGLRILDAMCGCGVRSLRYLCQADAAFVWANDAFEGNRGLIVSNLSRVPRVSADGERRWVVTHNDANRVLVESYLRREFFDLVDVDSFGSDSSFIRSAVTAVKDGGLLYLTSTDGFSSGGHRPYQKGMLLADLILSPMQSKRIVQWSPAYGSLRNYAMLIHPTIQPIWYPKESSSG